MARDLLSNQLRYRQLQPYRPVKGVGNLGENTRRGRQTHMETRHSWTWIRPKVNSTDTHAWPYGRDNGKTKLKHRQDVQYECDCPWCRKHLVLVGVMPPVFPSGASGQVFSFGAIIHSHTHKHEKESPDDLSSEDSFKARRLPTLPPGLAVPSAMTGLASLFGMGRGGSPSL